MGTFSTNLLATSRRLVRKYGQNISFDRIVEGAFVPSTGAVGAGTHTTYTAFGVPLPTPNREINGTTVLQSDTMMYLEVDDVSYIPLVGDVATFGGKAYRILSVANYVAQGDTLLYKLQLRI